MKLINLKSEMTRKEIQNLLSNMNKIEIEIIESLYSSINSVEYIDTSNKVCMFAICSSQDISNLTKLYSKYGIAFTIEDITQQTLMGEEVDLSFQSDDLDKSYIRKLIQEFRDTYTTQDIILDKILEKGIESLTDFDKSFLV